MTTPTQNPRPTPERIFQAFNAHHLTQALKAAIELDIFTAIGEGADTAAALAKRGHVAERGARILCDFLVVQGFLTKKGGRYGLTEESAAFLDQRSPTCMAACADFLTSSFGMDAMGRLADAVRRGGTAMSKEGSLEPEHPIWVQFARSMAPLQGMMAEMVTGRIGADAGAQWKVLDIAAGHGMFGISVARHNPNAEIHAVDWPRVLEVAKENAQKGGVARRYHTIPGDAFEVEWGTGYDVILITNFLHHCDPPAIEKFLRKVHAALKPGGRAVTLEFIPNEDRVSPPIPASFSLIMLAMTPAGEAYTFAEYERMYHNAGFQSNELQTLPTTHSIVISRK